jgi:hypothetical protein
MAVAVTLPPVPDGEVCLCRVYKTGSGSRVPRLGPPYLCGRQQTARGDLPRLELKLSGDGSHCDEGVKHLPDGVVLEIMQGEMIARQDGFALSFGSFQIGMPGAHPLFQGRIELIDRIGTHNAPASNCEEKCDQEQHIEGWLVGNLVQDESITLRAILALRITQGDVQTGVALDAVLAGVLVNCP